MWEVLVACGAVGGGGTGNNEDLDAQARKGPERERGVVTLEACWEGWDLLFSTAENPPWAPHHLQVGSLIPDQPKPQSPF